MDFAFLPPEINSGRMYTGAGAGPMLAAAAAWDELAAELSSTAASYASTVSSLTGGPWQGPSSSPWRLPPPPYVAWMNATAAQAEETGDQAKAAVAAYEAAFAATVPPPVIAANRALLDDADRNQHPGAEHSRRSPPPKPTTWRCGPRTPPRCTATPASAAAPRS